MTFDQDDSASELPGKSRDLFQRGIDVWVVQLARDCGADFVTGRLIGVRRIRIEVNAYGLRQEWRFRRSFPKAGWSKGRNTLVRLMGECSFLLKGLDD